MATAVDYGRMNIPNNGYMGYVNDARIGDEVVTEGLANDLEAFYNKTDSSDDRTKALDLLSAIRLGERTQEHPYPRPKTAMPSTGYHHSNPYVTSYTRDYPQKDIPFTGATRPMSSHGYKSGKFGTTHYDKEYMKKDERPATQIRSGTASGHRYNNPHPPQSFMVWKFPNKAKTTQQEASPWSADITDDMINQVHKRLCQSTYQTDYLGIPQGFQLNRAYTLPPDWKAEIPYTLDSVARYSYQNQPQQDELKLPVSRYGSNKKKQIAANGTIPLASTRYNHIKQRTTYDRQYNDTSSAVIQQIKDVGQKLGVEALKKYYERAAPEDKETIMRVLGTVPPAAEGQTSKPMHVPTPPPQRVPSRMSNRSIHPPSTPISENNNCNVEVNIPSSRNSVRYAPARTQTPLKKSGSRLACTPITDYANGGGGYPLQVQFPMQVPIPGGMTPDYSAPNPEYNYMS